MHSGNPTKEHIEPVKAALRYVQFVYRHAWLVGHAAHILPRPLDMQSRVIHRILKRNVEMHEIRHRLQNGTSDTIRAR